MQGLIPANKEKPKPTTQVKYPFPFQQYHPIPRLSFLHNPIWSPLPLPYATSLPPKSGPNIFLPSGTLLNPLNPSLLSLPKATPSYDLGPIRTPTGILRTTPSPTTSTPSLPTTLLTNPLKPRDPSPLSLPLYPLILLGPNCAFKTTTLAGRQIFILFLTVSLSSSNSLLLQSSPLSLTFLFTTVQSSSREPTPPSASSVTTATSSPFPATSTIATSSATSAPATDSATATSSLTTNFFSATTATSSSISNGITSIPPANSIFSNRASFSTTLSNQLSQST
ncbi:hypothetical protein HOY80DRAFT_1005663 [Tuber brumale]|nr:hypothetical protein HOY80DRAFT_1005663 [Tuber brumale]